VVNGVECSREIQEGETGDMLTSSGTDEMVVKSQEGGFSRVEFGICRLENIEE
jgi:hypothetical protein